MRGLSLKWGGGGGVLTPLRTMGHNKYNDVLVDKKHLRYSMNRIQSKNRRIETYEISKIYFLCLMPKFIMELMH